jgi:phosphoribosylformylglycinamidine synthase subunit PurS
VKEFMAQVRITPRQGLLDPEGNAIQGALRSLEFGDVVDVRAGRLLRVRIRAESGSAALARVEEMCRRLLANPVTEDFSVEVEGG